MSKMKLTDEDIVFLVEVTRINHEMEALVELVKYIGKKLIFCRYAVNQFVSNSYQNF